MTRIRNAMTVNAMTMMAAMFAGVALAALSSVPGHAHELVFGKIRIAHPWVAAKNAKSHETTGYVIEIQNDGAEADRLVVASLGGVPGVLRETVGKHWSRLRTGWKSRQGALPEFNRARRKYVFRE